MGAIEVIVLVAIAGFLVFCVLIVLPRGRETARLTGCQKNLTQIGLGVLLYEQAHRRYPATRLESAGSAGVSPIQAMLEALTLPDFLDLRDASQAPKASASPQPGMRVPGLVCPSDAHAGAGVFATALSYRANAGDEFEGTTGPFGPGQIVSSVLVEAADGQSFTAGFAERLVGTGQDGVQDRVNYREQLGPINAACGLTEEGNSHWRGDAGASWTDPGWRSALYTHAIPPATPTSCVASDGRTAAITASSAHPGRINVWMLDGSIRGTTPTVNQTVWKALGGYRSGDATSPLPP